MSLDFERLPSCSTLKMYSAFSLAFSNAYVNKELKIKDIIEN